tara:strand:- start:6956 stop:7714 length:759 start_codon:yes stop_codon:yes gene_type:complete
MLLLKLAKQFSGRGLKISSYTKPQEGRDTKKYGLATGADWEFRFENGSNYGITVRIQAKRLFTKSGKYEGLDGTGSQIQTLVANAGKSIPLYVFYNAPTSLPFFKRGRFSSLDEIYCGWPYFANENWGCAIAVPQDIPSIDRPRQDQVHQLPWHALICQCRGDRSKRIQRSITDLIAMNLREIYLARLDFDERESREPSRSFGDWSMPDFELNLDRPFWANMILEGLEPENLPEGVKGVALIRENREAFADD